MELLIYNRWGRKMFETKNINKGWDGMYEGKLCPHGVYAYVVKVRFVDLQEVIEHGMITLVR